MTKKPPIRSWLLVGVVTLFAASLHADDATTKEHSGSPTLGEPKKVNVEPPASPAEARTRAKLLHEMVRGTLQIMHRDFFDEDDTHAIPSASLEDVFQEMERGYGVELKWLVVNTDVVNVDHRPVGQFENEAAKSLAAGKPFVEATIANRYRFGGPIRLGSRCLKCHVKRRTSNEDRIAGLLISMPLQ